MANTIKQIKAVDSTGAAVTINAALTNLYINNKTNLCLETSAELGGKNINIESGKDIKLKPVDDVALYADHRAEKDEVSVKVMNGEGSDDVPVKLKLNASEMTLTTKDKIGDAADVFDITVNSAKDTRGYLKVRAQAIDLRSESHGGIALQPKGYDSTNHMNKIKFEHGGGDGLEFGTFNTERSSLFTDNYVFNKTGYWHMSTRNKIPSDKADSSDNTTTYKYEKQSNDFYDIINENDESCSTKSIIKTAHDLNEKYTCQTFSNTDSRGYTTQFGLSSSRGYILSGENAVPSDNFNDENVINLKSGVTYQSSLSIVRTLDYLLELGLDASSTVYQNIMNMDFNTTIEIKIHSQNGDIYAELWYVSQAPAIWFDSDGDSVLKAYNDVKLQSVNGSIKLNGQLDFGSNFDFGETDEGILYQKKHTKKGTKKSCDTIKIEYCNNSGSVVTYSDADYETPAVYNKTLSDIASGTTAIAASCSVADIIKLVAYMKNGKLGPWTV